MPAPAATVNTISVGCFNHTLTRPAPNMTVFGP